MEWTTRKPLSSTYNCVKRKTNEDMEQLGINSNIVLNQSSTLEGKYYSPI
jgi:hypothetical protein